MIRGGYFTYTDGLPTGYVCSVDYPDNVRAWVEKRMLDWYNSLPGQSRVRMGKRDRVLDPTVEVNLKRLENE